MDTGSYYVHDWNPFAFKIGDWGLPWYWLVYGLGFFWVYWCCHRLNRKYRQVEAPVLADFLVGGWFAMLVMARATYILLYFPSYYLQHPDEVLAVWQGGMSFHGGLLGVFLVAVFLRLRKRVVSLWHLTDLLAVAVPVLLFFGRLANFINGELAGRVSTVAWAVVFPRYEDGLPRHPSQIYEAVGEGLVVGTILYFCRNQLLQAGRLSSLFLIAYGLVRFVIEFFRLPDPQLGLLWAGLSLGQWLCILMILGGVLIWIAAARASCNHRE